MRKKPSRTSAKFRLWILNARYPKDSGSFGEVSATFQIRPKSHPRPRILSSRLSGTIKKRSIAVQNYPELSKAIRSYQKLSGTMKNTVDSLEKLSGAIRNLPIASKNYPELSKAIRSYRKLSGAIKNYPELWKTPLIAWKNYLELSKTIRSYQKNTDSFQKLSGAIKIYLELSKTYG